MKRCRVVSKNSLLVNVCAALVLIAGVLFGPVGSRAVRAESPEAGWSEQQIARLPESEKPVRLFNGKDFTGWEGQTDKYFSIEKGEIVARNNAENAPQASTYLVTKKNYRNFRLIFESKLVTSEMHSGIALWGKTVERAGDPFSYMGHLVMYPSGYGYYDLYRRNSIYRDDGRAKKAGHQHDWNRMEILAIGNRIRHVINGQLVADWSDPQPELCESGPIGLQLHSNKVPQEVRFRGLILTENPEDRLVTVEASAVDPKTAEKAEAVGMDAEVLARIPQRMEQLVANHQIAGAVTLVARKGKIVHLAATGKADIDANRPMTTDSLFAIASMTKPIASTAVMILVDEGKLSLDEPASKFIPEFKEAKLASGPPKREIAVRDLITHTSGLAGDQANEGTLAETAAKMARRPLAFEPGTKWQYSPGITICGRIVEVVAEQPFEDFLAARIFEPLGMKDTTFFPSTAQQKRLARAYQPGKDGKPLDLVDHWLLDFSASRTANPSGGLISSATDLARFYQMVLNGGTLDGKHILSRKAVEEMTRIHTGDLPAGFTPGTGWGLGWCVVREPQGPTQSLSPGSCGHGGYFGTQGWIDPQRDLCLVLLIQRSGFGNADASQIREAFQDLAIQAVRD